MRANDIMSRHVVTIDAGASAIEAINLMLSHHISGLPVLDAGKLVGLVSEGDFLRRAEIGTEKRRGRWLSLLMGADREALDYSRQHGRKVGQIMSANPITIQEDAPVDEIVRLMERRKIKRLPVMRGDELVGMVTRADFMAAIAKISRDGYRVPGADEDIKASVVSALSSPPWRPCALNVSVQDGVVTLKGNVGSDNAHKAAIIATENVPGVKRVDDQLSRISYPPPEEDYGGGDFVSLQEESSTTDDEPL